MTTVAQLPFAKSLPSSGVPWRFAMDEMAGRAVAPEVGSVRLCMVVEYAC